MLVRTAPAGPDIRQGRARTLCVAGSALAAALAWTVEVPLLGIDLNFRYGTSHRSSRPPRSPAPAWPPYSSAGRCSRC